VKGALDTNILVYALGVDDPVRRDVALDLLSRLPPGDVIVPVQVLGELFNVLVRKTGMAPDVARQLVIRWSDPYAVIETSSHVMQAALDLATDHHLSIWDAIVVATASHAGCRLLLSEDLQDGFTWGGVTVVNPFASPRHPLLDALLEQSAG
jgi:predicted nucleic acid-binding protein